MFNDTLVKKVTILSKNANYGSYRVTSTFSSTFSSDIVVYGYKNSTAELCAKEDGVKFVSLGTVKKGSYQYVDEDFSIYDNYYPKLNNKKATIKTR